MRLTNRRYRALMKVAMEGIENLEARAETIESFPSLMKQGEWRERAARLRNEAACARQGLAVINERFKMQSGGGS